MGNRNTFLTCFHYTRCLIYSLLYTSGYVEVLAKILNIGTFTEYKCPQEVVSCRPWANPLPSGIICVLEAAQKHIPLTAVRCLRLIFVVHYSWTCEPQEKNTEATSAHSINSIWVRFLSSFSEMDLFDCSRHDKPAGTRAFGPEDSWTA